MIDIREHGGIYADGGGGGGGMVTNKEEPLVIKNPEMFVDNSDVNALQKNVSEISNCRMIVYSPNIMNDMEIIKSGYGVTSGKFNEDFTNYCDKGGAYIITNSGFQKIGLPGVIDSEGAIYAISQKSDVILGKPNQSKEHVRLWYKTTSGFSEYTVKLEGTVNISSTNLNESYFLDVGNDNKNYFYVAGENLLHISLDHSNRLATIQVLTTRDDKRSTEYAQFIIPYTKKHIICLRHSITNLPDNKWTKSLVVDIYNLEGYNLVYDQLFSKIGPGTSTDYGSFNGNMKLNVGDGLSSSGTFYLKKEGLVQLGFSTNSSSKYQTGFSGLFKYENDEYQFKLIESYRDHYNVLGTNGSNKLQNVIPSDFPAKPDDTIRGLVRNAGGYAFETPTHRNQSMYGGSTAGSFKVSGRNAYSSATTPSSEDYEQITSYGANVASPYNKVPFSFYSGEYKVDRINLKNPKGFLVPKGPLKESVIIFNSSLYSEGLLGIIKKEKLRYKWVVGDWALISIYDSKFPINSCLFKIERDSRGKVTRMEKI